MERLLTLGLLLTPYYYWIQEDTISINHNWGNACNLTVLWAGLLSDLKQVRPQVCATSLCHCYFILLYRALCKLMYIARQSADDLGSPKTDVLEHSIQEWPYFLNQILTWPFVSDLLLFFSGLNYQCTVWDV